MQYHMSLECSIEQFRGVAWLEHNQQQQWRVQCFFYLTCVVGDNVLECFAEGWNCYYSMNWYLSFCHMDVQRWWNRWTYFYWLFLGSERWMAGYGTRCYFLFCFSTSLLNRRLYFNCEDLYTFAQHVITLDGFISPNAAKKKEVSCCHSPGLRWLI